MAVTIESIRDLAARGAVRFFGDSSLSMGGLQVNGADVVNALANGLAVEDRNGWLLVSGPTLDGETIIVICRVIGDHLAVRDVARP